jgi:hypothetical protein
MTDDRKNKPKGFAGFDSMTSDIEKEIEDLGKSTKPPPVVKVVKPANSQAASMPRAQPAPTQPAAPVYSAPQKTTGGAGKAWGWIIAVGFIVWLANSGSNSSKPTGPSSYSPPPSYQPASPAPAYVPTPAPTTTYEPPSYAEEKPPVGTGLSLNNSQMRYCLAEDIRLEAMKPLVNSYSETSVDGFNRFVNDYNQRCSQFKYRRGTLESIRSEVESRRSELEGEGISRALMNP